MEIINQVAQHAANVGLTPYWGKSKYEDVYGADFQIEQNEFNKTYLIDEKPADLVALSDRITMSYLSEYLEAGTDEARKNLLSDKLSIADAAMLLLSPITNKERDFIWDNANCLGEDAHRKLLQALTDKQTTGKITQDNHLRMELEDTNMRPAAVRYAINKLQDTTATTVATKYKAVIDLFKRMPAGSQVTLIEALADAIAHPENVPASSRATDIQDYQELAETLFTQADDNSHRARVLSGLRDSNCWADNSTAVPPTPSFARKLITILGHDTAEKKTRLATVYSQLDDITLARIASMEDGNTFPNLLFKLITLKTNYSANDSLKM